jgi:hypothetical protein
VTTILTLWFVTTILSQFNWWMVAAGWKHGMGSVSVMGKGGHDMPAGTGHQRGRTSP